tara:strand:+ start:10960 stop:12930 length:1971 start_codon:yes stop_codon:yes gene_type:complete
MKGKQLSFEEKDTDWELQAKEVPEEDIREVASIALDQDWTPPSSFPEHYRDANVISIDLETRDPNLMTLGPGWARDDGYIIGYAVAFNDFCGYYPIRHEVGGNMPEKAVTGYIKDMMKSDVPKVMHNAQYDLGWLRWAGIEVQGPVYDTMTAAAMLNENRRWYNLNSLAADYLQERKNERLLRLAAADYGVDAKSGMWQLPARFVGQYAEQDASVTRRLWERLQPDLIREEVSSIFDLETELTPMLLNMRWRGVRVDEAGAENARKLLEKREKEIHKWIKDETGLTVEPWNATSLSKAFDKMKVAYPRTEKTDAPSFTKQFLASHEHPLAQQIVRLRELNKANTTFISNILKFTHKGRIHAEFHPLRSDDGGTVTGRFSSSNPNLQQIPARDPEIKSIIRGLFLPEEGEKWGSFDYASQEPRWLAHYCASISGVHRHPSIDDVVEQYQNDDADFHQMVADMAGISRKDAKTVNLGIMYGMGVNKMAGVLDTTVEEAKELLNEYHDKVPFVRGLANMVSNHASENGQIRTILGRKCRFPLWEPKTFGIHKPLPLEEAVREHGRTSIKRAFTYKALNRLIQGSSADQTKKAMIDCYKAGYLPMLQVHDELCFSIDADELGNPNENQITEIARIMEGCVEAKVPFKVDCSIADNWGQVD